MEASPSWDDLDAFDRFEEGCDYFMEDAESHVWRMYSRVGLLRTAYLQLLQERDHYKHLWTEFALQGNECRCKRGANYDDSWKTEMVQMRENMKELQKKLSESYEYLTALLTINTGLASYCNKVLGRNKSMCKEHPEETKCFEQSDIDKCKHSDSIQLGALVKEFQQLYDLDWMKAKQMLIEQLKFTQGKAIKCLIRIIFDVKQFCNNLTTQHISFINEVIHQPTITFPTSDGPVNLEDGQDADKDLPEYLHKPLQHFLHQNASDQYLEVSQHYLKNLDFKQLLEEELEEEFKETLNQFILRAVELCWNIRE